MKFDHILFPIDFSDRSRQLNKQVEWLAARFGSRVTMLHVFEIPAACYWADENSFFNTDGFRALRGSAEQRLTSYAIQIPEARVERVLAQGDVAAEIMNRVNSYDVDLVVMGTHGCGGLHGWLLGSVAAKLLHSAACPVWTDSLLYPRPNPPAITKILCAVELTSEALPLLTYTRDLARELDAGVKLVHSVPELETRPNRYFDFDLHRYLMESARVEIAKVQRQAGTDFPVVVSGAGISDALAEAASEHGADLIVIGRGKAQKAFGRFQTHACEIIRSAPCPVLSYSLRQQDRIFSACAAERLWQPAEDEPVATACPAP